ncbi:MAG: hypothetical protein GC186_13855 [Rhodobacteraceae bacterium]|nr:hypothetical protein [Paracoccaceae bacterium]
MKRIKTRLASFLRDTRGTITAEALVALPLLIWAHLATYQYFDAFLTIARNDKATYTLADMISRQTGTVTPTFIDGMNTLYAYLDRSETTNTAVRVTCLSWNPALGANGEYYVVWSDASGTGTPLTSDTLQDLISKFPVIAASDTLILVETKVGYTPSFKIVGMKSQELNSYVVTRPRISPQVVYKSS